MSIRAWLLDRISPHRTAVKNTRTVTGRVSCFGGPSDTGVTPSEGLALFEHLDLLEPEHAALFLPRQPHNTTGLARRLDPSAHYIALRWDYTETPRAFLRTANVTITANGITITGVRPVDWGPNIRTGRIADLSPGLLAALHITTDDEATITYPLPSPRAT